MANIKKLPLFVRCVIQNFPFIEEDFDALTNYELISKVVEFLNKVISSQNEVIGVANDLSAEFQQLHDYVENYFDNLDVQEEINNKLDAMVEAGTLQEIITTYIQSNVAWTFDTVADMKLATNLVDGSYAQTLGFYSINDGGGALYKISDTGTADEIATIAVGDLYATIVSGEKVSVKQLGAYGDDTHNDSTAISFALNNYKTVFIPTGTYLLGTAVAIANAGLKVYGENDSILHVNTGGHGFTIDNYDNITLEGLTLKAPEDYTIHAAHATHHLIKVANADYITVKNCILTHGVLGVTFENCSYILFENNMMDYFSGWGVVFGANQTEIKHVKVVNNTSSNSSYDGIKMTGYITDILVEGNSCFDNASDGFDFAGHTAKNVIITNNSFYNNTLNGCDFKQLTRTDYPFDETKTKQFFNVTISNNVCTENLNHHINLQLPYDDVNIHNIYVINNNINLKSTNANGTGIRVAYCQANAPKAILIKNNNITSTHANNYDYGIRINDCKNIYIDSNYITGIIRVGVNIDNAGDAEAEEQYITVINNTIINNRTSGVCIHGDASVSNCIFRSNLLKNDYGGYLLGNTLINESTNLFIENKTIDTFASKPSSYRANKYVIYLASDPITAGCMGWIANENGGGNSSRYTTYIALT